jgi:prepilin-type N-terminal cleavage/methylation domain-containing protein
VLSRSRRGFTLLELVMSMTLAGIVLAMIASVSMRQQRIFADTSDRAALSGQLRDAASIVPIDLRALTPRAGDIREARDTSIELRATIAGAIVCDTAPNAIVLAPVSAGATTFASFATATDVGDTAWVLTSTDSADSWVAYRITAVGSAPGASCARGGPLTDSAASATRTRLTLDRSPPLVVGTAVRITRPVRYSLYRASDNQWYLGERDWSTTTARFNTIQPVAGPFMAASTGGLSLAYFDSGGAQLAAPVADTRGVSYIRVQLIGQTRAVTRALGASATTATRRGDSAVAIVVLRNRK